MQYGVRFSKSAEKDLNSIQKYIYQDNRQAATVVVSYILEEIQNTIAQNPALGRPGRVFGTRELIITKYPYIVPYQFKDGQVFILRVLHTSRMW